MYPEFHEQVVENIYSQYKLVELHFTSIMIDKTARADPNL